MITIGEVFETNEMIWNEHLDVRTITLGISLLDCITDDLNKLNENTQEYLLWKIIEKEEKAEAIYWKIYREFKIVKPYELLPENQTTIFIFLFLILLIFLKSFRKYFLKKG